MGQERELRNTNDWHIKAQQIKERANYLCEYCRSRHIYVYEGLEVHHITKVKDDPTKLLDDSNLVCLCTKCHKLAEAGLISADELRDLAAIRERGY